MNIVTTFVHPPIPYRTSDWSAIDDDTYDGPGSPIGRGATEQEAIDDLREQMAAEREVVRNAELLGIWAALAAASLSFWFVVWHFVGPLVARVF